MKRGGDAASGNTAVVEGATLRGALRQTQRRR